MELTEIERQRRALEENVQKLRQSLKHWQTWEAEYEGLKEELIATGPEELTAEAVSEICKTYGGALVTEKEILELAGQQAADSSSPPRRRGQILGQISRRQEYVQRNIDTISKQFFVAEGKLEEFAFASVTASGVYGDGIGEDDDEGGLPLSEIHEELDDDDNFVRGEVRRPEEATGKVLERLRMAGLSEKDLGAAGAKTDSVETAAPTSPQRSSAIKLPLANAASASKDAPAIDSGSPERPAIRKKSVSFSADTKEGEEMSRSNSEERKKSVSFADKVAIARAAPPPDTRSVSFSQDVEEIPAPTAASELPQDPTTQQIPINTDPDSQSHLRGYFKPGDKVFEVNEETETTQPHIVMPEGESEEDAAMRREMLNYHLNEVNNVVATMQLDDPDDDDDEHDDSHSEYTTSEYQDEDTPYTSGLSDSDAEDEDEFGRSKRPAVTDAYRDEMEALKACLIGNLGKIALPDEVEADDADAEIDPADARRLVIREKRSSIISNSSDGEKKPSAAGKKRVSFAEALDVAKPSSPPHKANKHVEGESVPPIVGGVAERTTAVSHSLPTATSPASFSRFKQARAKAAPADEEEDTQSGVPTGPPGIPMADTLLERTPATVKAPDADGYDPLLARRELASEYYRRRNDMVREQGGFKIQKDEDDDMGDLMEERDDGQVKKVSRFKAARLGR